MIPRTAMSKPDYDQLMRARFYADGEDEDVLYERHQALVNALCDRIESHGLSALDDIYVLFDCFRTKIVFLNFIGDRQLLAESIACDVLNQEQWPDFAVVLSPGGDEAMILDGEAEAITRDGIFVQLKS